MDGPAVIAAVAILVSIATFVVTLWTGRRAEVRARRPVLVFVDEPSRDCWVLRNVGNGPALNVLIAQRKDGSWFNPVKLPPLGRDAAFDLTWLGRVNDTGLGATYVDFEGHPFTSTVGEEVVRTVEGARLPAWTDDEVERYWSVPAVVTSATRWASKPSDFTT